MALPLPLDPTPTSVESFVRALPADARAALEWFPKGFRDRVVAPLVERGSDELSLRLVDELAVPAAELFARLGSSLAHVLRDGHVAVPVLDASSPIRLHPEAHARLGSVDPRAAQNLAGAVEWLNVIVGALARDFRGAVVLGAEPSPELDLDAESMREELDGPLGYFVRGTMLVSASIDVLLRSQPLPPALASWCSVALLQLQAAANVLRAQGLRIPTALRSHDTSSRLRDGLLPPGLLERLVREFAPQEVWLFGSRATGTHGPNSDYDLLVVVDDDADTDALTSWSRIARLRHANVDLVAVSRRDFDEAKVLRGTLSNVVTEDGRRIYER